MRASGDNNKAACPGIIIEETFLKRREGCVTDRLRRNFNLAPVGPISSHILT
jgi:hypothetical protein